MHKLNSAGDGGRFSFASQHFETPPPIRLSTTFFSYANNAQIVQCEEIVLSIGRPIVVVIASEITQFFIVPLLQHCFAISYRRENQRQYELKAATESGCKAWIDAIREAR